MVAPGQGRGCRGWAPQRNGSGFDVPPLRQGLGRGGLPGRDTLGRGMAGRGGRFPPRSRIHRSGEPFAHSLPQAPLTATSAGLAWVARDSDQKHLVVAILGNYAKAKKPKSPLCFRC